MAHYRQQLQDIHGSVAVAPHVAADLIFEGGGRSLCHLF